MKRTGVGNGFEKKHNSICNAVVGEYNNKSKVTDIHATTWISRNCQS